MHRLLGCMQVAAPRDKDAYDIGMGTGRRPNMLYVNYPLMAAATRPMLPAGHDLLHAAIEWETSEVVRTTAATTRS